MFEMRISNFQKHWKWKFRIFHGIQMSLSPIHIQNSNQREKMSEGGRKIVRIIESFELQKFE